MDVTLNPQDLQKITELTLGHYNHRAEAYWEGTRDHDVGQNIETLLRSIEGKPPFAILDLGCGPGRDLKVFAELGHVAIGVESAPRFAEMARAYSGCMVWQQDFLRLDLPENHFDGVFANGAFHDLDAWRGFMSAAGFVEISYYYRPAGVPRDQQSWLASVWRRDDRSRDPKAWPQTLRSACRF